MTSKPRGHIHYAAKPLLTEFRIYSEFEVRHLDIYRMFRSKYAIPIKLSGVDLPYLVVFVILTSCGQRIHVQLTVTSLCSIKATKGGGTVEKLHFVQIRPSCFPTTGHVCVHVMCINY